ncbi:MAG: SDR family NAD(P)-dependent oxidoreductase [Proteobacteria bacterium]|nr:SDR family NAD(P)-dependent oxidoreductase [Pseudomonadota bacterium]MBK8957032.1 SDR family NAD(P)-dependent oxidoreductase [Pseudomonadota bacterium]
MREQGQVGIITGAASGIGRALALELARRGATLVVSDIDGAGAAEVATAINAMRPDSARAVTLDVTDADAVAALVGDTVAAHGRLDLMFNNAGISITGDARDLSIAQWRRVIDINLMGVVYGSDAAYKAMARQGCGHIVNIASLAGLVPFPTNAPYGATKHAVVGLSLALRAEGEDLGVRVSAVCPGFVDSNIFNATEVVNASREKLIAGIPFRKVSVEEAATRILDGVARNRAMIVFPAYAQLLWWGYRLVPDLLAPLGRKLIRDLRKIRGAA